jgi:recombination protein RecA
VSANALKQKIVDSVLSKAKSGEALFLEERPVRGFISTTDVNLDFNIGRPGIPLGRVTEVSGWSGSGKSMLCCHLIGEVQRQGGVAVLIDTERSYTSDWASRMGVNTEDLIDPVEFLAAHNEEGIITLEDALIFIESILDSVDDDEETPVVVVIDSLSALPTRSDMDSDYSQGQPARHASIMSKAMRKLTQKTESKKVALVFVTQLREAIMQFGASETSIGGHAIPFHAALQLRMRRKEFLKEKGKNVGFRSIVKIIKNKLGGVPYIEVPVCFFFKDGIDPIMSHMALALDLGIILPGKKGWYGFASGEGKKFQESKWPTVATEELLEEIISTAFQKEGGEIIEGG